MSETLTALAAPLAALRLLAVDFPALPVANIAVSRIYPDRLELSFHEDFPGFEAWRAALRIDTGAVAYHEQSGGRTQVLTASTDYAGAHVRLTGYSTHPDTVALCGEGE
ncbi:hypothetical protein [Streptomyces lushanensis]|uniref:hypothetical protein n=1 Tax=Streptomyces lushanensis TaxID=1434255 RepID=UPI00082B10A3|nr:hypothetical protein [Streptomyces lushanensis]